MFFSDKVMEIFEDYLQESLDCKVTVFEGDDRFLVECSGCYNPGGEDWILNLSVQRIDIDDLKDISSQTAIRDLSLLQVNKALYNEYIAFDVDEDVRIWADSAGNGKTPGFKTLVENAEYKQNRLFSLWSSFYSYPNVQSLLPKSEEELRGLSC